MVFILFDWYFVHWWQKEGLNGSDPETEVNIQVTSALLFLTNEMKDMQISIPIRNQSDAFLNKKLVKKRLVITARIEHTTTSFQP